MARQYRANDGVNIILAVVILFLAIIGDTILVKSIENEKRKQARYNLEQISHCYNRIHDKFSIVSTFAICTEASKTTLSGDAYIINPDTMEFIHENSNDIPSGLFFNKESVGKYFQDWSSAETALAVIMLGKDSEPGDEIGYDFDGSEEWIEWKILPNDINRLEGKMIVVQGIQRDEVLKNYTFYRRFGAAAVAMVVMIMLITHNANVRRRGSGDAI